MKVLFILRTPGLLRMYASVIKELASQGVQVHIAFNSLKKREGYKILQDVLPSFNLPNIHFQKKIAITRVDLWGSYAKLIYALHDYLRYLHPRYADAEKLRQRAADRVGLTTQFFFRTGIAYLGSTKLLNAWIKALEWIQQKIPVAETTRKYLKQINPDVVLISPLVDLASNQCDYVFAVKSLGIPCVALIASWDNLSNKGLLKGPPDKVVVWNSIQKTEAVELHGYPEKDVVVTGAQCFDKWFEKKPTQSKEDFSRRVGLDPSRGDYLLYLCSSPFIAPNEVDFVKDWIKGLRASSNSKLKNINILIRPHPQNAAQWEEVSQNDLGPGVTLYPRKGENPVKSEQEATYFDSIFHSVGVFGINTSGMVESSIFEKPVFTVLDSRFKDTQTGTLHFHYLRKYQLIVEASSLEKHYQQLGDALDQPEMHRKRLRTFVQDFIRPFGLDVPATPKLVEFILSTKNLKQKEPSVQNYRRPNVVWEWFWKQGARIFVGSRGVTRLIEKHGFKKSMSFLFHFAVQYPIKKLKREKLNLTDLYQFFSRKKMDRSLGKIKKVGTSGQHIVLGPWVAEVGFEVLYWIPFINWFKEKYEIPSERLHIISRGGADLWYRHITPNYTDLFDLFSPQEYQDKNAISQSKPGSLKHQECSDFDLEVYQRYRDRTDARNFEILHPSLMYGLFDAYWKGAVSTSLIRQRSQFLTFSKDISFDEKIFSYLPKDYVAVKFYFSPCFPDTQKNRDFLRVAIKNLAKTNNVVVMSTGLKIDDHRDSEIAKVADRIFHIDQFTDFRNNLNVQTQIIARAKKFFGTYGGFSYLPLFYGKPSISFYSNMQDFLPKHMDIATRAARFLKFGAFEKQDGRSLEFIEFMITKGNPRFTAIDTDAYLDILSTETELRAQSVENGQSLSLKDPKKMTLGDSPSTEKQDQKSISL